jgi:hypothetical protein
MLCGILVVKTIYVIIGTSFKINFHSLNPF